MSRISLSARRWVFTINNPENLENAGELFRLPLEMGVRFVIWQHERGSQGETDHIQGYLELQGPWRRSRVEAMLGGHAWVEPAKGKQEQCIAYCSKEDTRIAGPWRVGSPSGSRQGERTDLKPLDAAVAELVAGKSLTEIDPGVFVRHANGLRALVGLRKPPFRQKMKVVCIQGGTGIGKTHWVYEHFPEVYRPNYGNGGLWWDGYQGEKTILIDEYRGQCPMGKFLQILDKYPLMLEVKGAYVPAMYETVFITCNTGPVSWYTNAAQLTPQDFQALNRRVGIVPHPETDSHYVVAEDREDLRRRLTEIFRDHEAEAAAAAPLQVLINPDNGDDYPIYGDDNELDNHSDGIHRSSTVELESDDEDPGNQEAASWYSQAMTDSIP